MPGAERKEAGELKRRRGRVVDSVSPSFSRSSDGGFSSC